VLSEKEEKNEGTHDQLLPFTNPDMIALLLIHVASRATSPCPDRIIIYQHSITGSAFFSDTLCETTQVTQATGPPPSCTGCGDWSKQGKEGGKERGDYVFFFSFSCPSYIGNIVVASRECERERNGGGGRRAHSLYCRRVGDRHPLLPTKGTVQVGYIVIVLVASCEWK